MNSILEHSILLCDPEIFGDNEEHAFDIECHDGYAVGTSVDKGEKITSVKMTYPTRQAVLSDQELADRVLRYRGLYDLTADDIHYGDIMMCLGVITK